MATLSFPAGRSAALLQSRVAYALALSGSVFVLFMAGTAMPQLVREDGAFESATALAFALAALAAATLLMRDWPRLDASRKGVFCAAGAFSALAFLSEVSFGARLFGWSMPKMEGGGELDGAHDLAIIVVRWARSASALALGLVLSAVLGVGAALAWLLRARIVQLARRTLHDSVLFGLAAAAVLLVGAVVLDSFSMRGAEVLEEALETVAGFNLLCAFMLGLARRGLA